MFLCRGLSSQSGRELFFFGRVDIPIAPCYKPRGVRRPTTSTFYIILLIVNIIIIIIIIVVLLFLFFFVVFSSSSSLRTERKRRVFTHLLLLSLVELVEVSGGAFFSSSSSLHFLSPACILRLLSDKRMIDLLLVLFVDAMYVFAIWKNHGGCWRYY